MATAVIRGRDDASRHSHGEDHRMVYALGLDLGGGPVTAAVSTPEGASPRVHVHPEPPAVVDGLLDRLGDPVPANEDDTTPGLRLAELVVACVRTVAAAEGEEPGAVTVAHPTSWGPYRVGLLRTALTSLGLEPGLVPAAIAAVAHAQEVQDAHGVVAVLDVREDHLEVSVVATGTRGPAGALVGAARTVTDLGSADVDDAVVAHVRRLAFPGTTPSYPPRAGAADRREGSRRPARAPQHRAGAPEPDPAPDAVARALAHRLREACADAAAQLVTTAAATVAWETAGERHEVRVVAGEVDAYVRPRAGRAIAAAAEAVAAAAPAGVDRVLLVGRIAAMPLLTELVAERFEAPVAVVGADSAAVARGAAEVAQAADAVAATAAAATAPAGTAGGTARRRRAHVRHARRRPGSAVTVLGGGVVALGIAALAVWGTAVASPGSPAQGHTTAVAPVIGTAPPVSPSPLPTAVLPTPTGSAPGLAGVAAAGRSGSTDAPGSPPVLGPPPAPEPPTVLRPGASSSVARTAPSDRTEQSDRTEPSDRTEQSESAG